MPAASPPTVSKVEAWREWARLSEGCYVLRSNVTDWSPEDLWRAYIQLTEAEAAFHIHKSDLGSARCGIRKKIECRPTSWFAFWPTCSGRLWPRVAARRDWRRTAASVRSLVGDRDGRCGAADQIRRVIRKRCISQPTEHQQSCSSGSD